MTDSDREIIDYLGFDLPGENQLAQARRTALLRGLEGSAELHPWFLILRLAWF